MRPVIACSGLLQHLGISKVDVLGESYGGATAILIALQRPDLVRRVATYGTTFGPAEEAHNLEMLRFDKPPTPDSKCFHFQRESYKKVAPDPEYWPTFWNKGARIQSSLIGRRNRGHKTTKAPIFGASQRCG